LAKKLFNPISDMVSVPFQFNSEQLTGSLELSQFIQNIQRHPVLVERGLEPDRPFGPRTGHFVPRKRRRLRFDVDALEE